MWFRISGLWNLGESDPALQECHDRLLIGFIMDLKICFPSTADGTYGRLVRAFILVQLLDWPIQHILPLLKTPHVEVDAGLIMPPDVFGVLHVLDYSGNEYSLFEEPLLLGLIIPVGIVQFPIPNPMLFIYLGQCPPVHLDTMLS